MYMQSTSITVPVSVRLKVVELSEVPVAPPVVRVVLGVSLTAAVVQSCVVKAMVGGIVTITSVASGND